MNVIEKKEGEDSWSVSTPSSKNNNLYNFNIQRSIKNNNQEAAQFLDLIAEDEMITFQTFDDVKNRKDPKLIRVLHGTLEQHLSTLIDLNKQGAGIFFTVNTTDLQGREAKNVIKIRALFVDLDGVPLEPVLSAPLSPHIIVETSPKRFHAYWIVDGIAGRLQSLNFHYFPQCF